jgi:chromate reductase, NAD(P)H dehydrogenase (quinone)
VAHEHVFAWVAASVEEGDSMETYSVGYLVGSLAAGSINRILSKALIKVAPADLRFVEIAIKDLPLYSYDYDDDYPPAARALKTALAGVNAVLFVSPEYNRSIPGSLKNAIDWASRPRGQNSFARKPSAIIGASTGQIGTAVMQASLRSVLAFCNSPQLNAPEAYIRFSREVFTPDGEVLDPDTKAFLTFYMEQFREFIIRVLTVVPQNTPGHLGWVQS